MCGAAGARNHADQHGVSRMAARCPGSMWTSGHIRIGPQFRSGEGMCGGPEALVLPGQFARICDFADFAC